MSIENQRWLIEIQRALHPSEFHGLRYVFGTGFRCMKFVVEIYRELVSRRGFSDEDAIKTIEDCLIACGCKHLLKKQCSDSFKIGGSHFSKEEIKGMQERAVCVKVVKYLDERPEKWLEFLLIAMTEKANIRNTPEDKFDDFRDLESKKVSILDHFKKSLDVMEEKAAMDIIDAYKQEQELSDNGPIKDGLGNDKPIEDGLGNDEPSDDQSRADSYTPACEVTDSGASSEGILCYQGSTRTAPK